MSIKLCHLYIDARAGGLVNVLYMHAWFEAHSDRTLLGLVNNMCECFSVNKLFRQGAGVSEWNDDADFCISFAAAMAHSYYMAL